MKTRDCIGKWVNGMIDGIGCDVRANSCYSLGEFFVSYSTPIAKFCGDHFEVATKKYSCTTSKQQNYLRFFIPSEMLVEVESIKSDKFPFARR